MAARPSSMNAVPVPLTTATATNSPRQAPFIHSFKMRLLSSHISLVFFLITNGLSSPSSSTPRDAYLREILAGSNYPEFRTTPTPADVPLKVGIIGAGAAGLYAAVLLDSLGIDYDLLEASDRVGGRILTHRFNETAWSQSTPSDPDYYDYYVSVCQGKMYHVDD